LSITINAITTSQMVGASFTISGTWRAAAPGISVKADTGGFSNISPQPAQPAVQNWSETYAGFSTPGTHTLTVQDAAGETATTTVTVVAQTTGHATKYGPGQSVTTLDGHVFGLDASGDMMWDGAQINGGQGTSFIAYDPTVGGSTGQKYGQDAASGDWYTWSPPTNWNDIKPATPNFGTTPPPVAGPGHGPALMTPANAQSFPGRSNVQNWGNVLVSTGISVDTQVGLNYGNITYIACECNSPGQAEFGRPGEIKMLYGAGVAGSSNSVTAVFFKSGVVLGPPDVPVDPNGNIYYNAEGWSDPAYGGMIWRYAGGPANMVINDWSSSAGDVLNIRGDYQAAGVTVTHPTSTDTLVQIHFDGGSVYIYNHTLAAGDIVWN
jgi:hypothetical protein